MSKFQIFSTAEIDTVRRAGRILADCLRLTAAEVRAGVTTKDLDAFAEQYILAQGGLPAFKGYRNYPSTLCISVNDECVHGLPGPRMLHDGDIVSLDGGVLLDGLYTDACVTVSVGPVSADAQRLLNTTNDALAAALEVVRAGATVGDVSSAVEKTAKKGGCKVLHALTGHGLGHTLHQFPDIPNYGKAGKGPTFPANTVVAIEPILSLGTEQVRDTADGWTILTADGSLAAHSEHTILVTADGCEVIA